ncbi:MAG TPA: ABC-2 transporter permease, partial [Treponemataceae bacterium]|nr:ABC-2 transporter permease [Treponemataceae bacterium]
MKKTSAVWPVLLARELKALYQSPVAWIVTVLFLVFSGFLFFPTFFLINRAELRNFFQLLPVLFSFFIPALTMRVLSEESRSGSLETLLTLPVSGADVVASKFLSVLVFIAGMLLPTAVYVVSVSL